MTMVAMNVPAQNRFVANGTPVFLGSKSFLELFRRHIPGLGIACRSALSGLFGLPTPPAVWIAKFSGLIAVRPVAGLDHLHLTAESARLRWHPVAVFGVMAITGAFRRTGTLFTLEHQRVSGSVPASVVLSAESIASARLFGAFFHQARLTPFWFFSCFCDPRFPHAFRGTRLAAEILVSSGAGLHQFRRVLTPFEFAHKQNFFPDSHNFTIIPLTSPE